MVSQEPSNFNTTTGSSLHVPLLSASFFSRFSHPFLSSSIFFFFPPSPSSILFYLLVFPFPSRFRLDAFLSLSFSLSPPHHFFPFLNLLHFPCRPLSSLPLNSSSLPLPCLFISSSSYSSPSSPLPILVFSFPEMVDIACCRFRSSESAMLRCSACLLHC